MSNPSITLSLLEVHTSGYRWRLLQGETPPKISFRGRNDLGIEISSSSKRRWAIERRSERKSVPASLLGSEASREADRQPFQ